VLVKHDVLVHDRAQPLLLELGQGLEAKVAQGGAVGVGRRVAAVADGDRFAERLQQLDELRLVPAQKSRAERRCVEQVLASYPEAESSDPVEDLLGCIDKLEALGYAGQIEQPLNLL
jgi:hypothetical protein